MLLQRLITRMEVLDREKILRSKTIDLALLVMRWAICQGTAGTERINISLAADIGRCIGLSVHNLVTLYLFRTITLRFRTIITWKECSQKKSVFITSKKCRNSMLRRKI
jgi:hypothetical protein